MSLQDASLRRRAEYESKYMSQVAFLPFSPVRAFLAAVALAATIMALPTPAGAYDDPTKVAVNTGRGLFSLFPGGQSSQRRAQVRRTQDTSAYQRQVVEIRSDHAPGTIIIDSDRRYLYLVQQEGTAIRYGVGVGRPGFEWAGTHRITRKEEWPDWRPPAEMRQRQPYLPAFMPGGPKNPLGARALYIGSTLYRIHGTNEAQTIGQAVSSGCIRMLNEDVIDLYSRVGVGTKVVVF